MTRIDPPLPHRSARKATGTGIAGALFLAAAVFASPVSTAFAQTPDQLVDMAREAARSDRNKDSADLFQRALEANPALRKAVLREYADQLTYSGRSAQAVPLYREVLAGNPPEDDRKRAERGLALALLWSGQFEEAVAAWQRILSADPADADARNNLREGLINAARAAAAKDENGQAADLFARAIELDKDRRSELLLDYATQLTFAGRGIDALPYYDEALASGKLSKEDEVRARRERAVVLMSSGQTEEAVAAWQAILDAKPDDAEARNNLREAMVNAARAAADRNDNALSAAYFGKAIDLDKARRLELLVDFAAQLTYAGYSKDALPLFDEALASGKLSKEAETQARRGRALALLWSGQSDESIAAWQRIVDADPNDADARKNLREALVNAARAAASRNDNAQSAALFARAIDLDPSRRMELLLDYAAQLTFSGRAKDALPLFDEALASGKLSDEEQARVRRDRALALLWSGQDEEAVATWQKILDANPDDADARKNLWDALVNAAKAAAARNENAQAADLFARAIAVDQNRRMELLLVFAAQLTYSGRAHEALPLYDEALASGKLSKEGEQEARRGRALALLWSGQTDQSVAAWQKILDANPNDPDARKNLREALVGAARSAASRNENALSAALFARAISLDKGRRVELLREYATQLTYAGRAKQAVPLFDEAIASGKLSKADEAQARRGRALALLWSGRYLEAINAWRAFLRANPNDMDARKNVTEALVGAAREAASQDRNAESASLYARAIALSPSRRLELAVEYANQLTYSGKPENAVPLYREALDSRTLNREERRAALLGLALALDWSGEKSNSLDVYDRVLRLYPDSVQALVGRGNVLNQLDRNKEALASFERAILLAPGSTEPVRNAGRSLSFLGRQRLALERLAPLLAGNPDRETLLVAAQAELWKGRPDNALALADQVLAMNPDDEQAQAIAAEIAMNQRPLTDVNAAVSTQNDGLVISGVTLRQSIGMNDGMRTVGVQARTVELNPDSGDSVRMNGFGLFGRNRFNDMFELNGSFFLNSVTTGDSSRIEPTYDAWLTMWPNDFLRFDFSVGRSYFDDVQSVSDNILIDTVGASVDFVPDPDTRLTGRANYGFISDGNRRVFAQGEVERRFIRQPNIFAGARTTYMTFSEPDLDNGYFNTPWLYNLAATLRLEAQPAMGWNVWASGSAGYEWQPDSAKPIWSAALATSYMVSNQFKLDAEISHQDSADTGGSDAFRRTTLSGGFEYRW